MFMVPQGCGSGIKLFHTCRFRLPVTGRRFCFGSRDFHFRIALLCGNREGVSDFTEIVYAYASSSNKQYCFIVGRSKSPNIVAVADDVRCNPYIDPQ